MVPLEGCYFSNFMEIEAIFYFMKATSLFLPKVFEMSLIEEQKQLIGTIYLGKRARTQLLRVFERLEGKMLQISSATLGIIPRIGLNLKENISRSQIWLKMGRIDWRASWIWSAKVHYLRLHPNPAEVYLSLLLSQIRSAAFHPVQASLMNLVLNLAFVNGNFWSRRNLPLLKKFKITEAGFTLSR